MRHYKKIEALMKVVMANKIKRGGVPMAAIIFDFNGNVIGKPMTNIRKGSISKLDADEHKHHAEQLIKKFAGSLPKKFILISLLPPCTKCLAAITHDADRIEIYYLTDSIRRRFSSPSYNQEISLVLDKVSFSYLEVHKKWWNRIKIYYWYMIANLLHSSLHHGGVDKANLRKEVDEFICKIEDKIKNEHSRKEITFIKNDLEFLKSDDIWKKAVTLKSEN